MPLLKQHIANALGRKVGTKIVVIESDDWGSVRMPSRKVFEILKKNGLDICDSYNRYDSLATESDLSAMFDVIDSFRDHRGKPPTITANCLVANPDFDRIREANFEQYFFEEFTETLKRSPGCQNSFKLWREGIARRVFHPQYHGREHLNVPAWLAALRRKDHDACAGFEHGFWGHTIRDRNARRRYFLAAYDYSSSEEKDYVCRVATEGMKLFEEMFGYKSRSFIAPNFVWSAEIEKTLFALGAELVQGQRKQLIPLPGRGGWKTKFHYTGQKNRLGQRYLVRNCYFEPSSDPAKDWVGSCLKDIGRAFFWKTPAIISAHRVNFIGSIVEKNRTRNLLLFRELLSKILRKWPDVEFLTTDQLF